MPVDIEAIRQRHEERKRLDRPYDGRESEDVDADIDALIAEVERLRVENEAMRAQFTVRPPWPIRVGGPAANRCQRCGRPVRDANSHHCRPPGLGPR